MNKEELYEKCENMEELYDKYYLPLLEENKNLTHMIANKVLSSYEYNSPLKDSLNEANLKIVALEMSNNNLESNWKALKEWLEENTYKVHSEDDLKLLESVISKMNELEGDK